MLILILVCTRYIYLILLYLIRPVTYPFPFETGLGSRQSGTDTSLFSSCNGFGRDIADDVHMASVLTAIRRVGREREGKAFIDKISKWKGDYSWARIDIPLVVAGNESRPFVEEVSSSFAQELTQSRALLFYSELGQYNFFISDVSNEFVLFQNARFWLISPPN
ncbi:hypothetical protein AVEN_114162-1 [Araneus ventricosus]|uniref:Uncharacterized protein n=1 Tax=Araneus ventricosus TaxID=182803 RepID=A0A4Y2R1A5_ARAVE|nr:hypothetical protein AVEN_114162-1 [Araneus ventricosus]